MVENLEQRMLCSASSPGAEATATGTPWPDASSVTVTRADGLGSGIGRRQVTWVIIHGLLGSKDAPGIRELAAAVDGASSKDQVLVVDWRQLAGTDISGKQMEANAEAAADVVAGRLRAARVRAGRINVIGFSMGALVAARVAEDLHDRGGVNAIVALDPASPALEARPGRSSLRAAYDLSADSRYSIAFHGQDAASPLSRASTADATIRVDNVGETTFGKHAGVFEVFTRMTERNNTGDADDVSRVFSVERIASATMPLWRKNSYDMPGANSWGYEAVLTAQGDAGSLSPDTLIYQKPSGLRRHVFAA